MDLIVLQQYSTSGCPLRPAWSAVFSRNVRVRVRLLFWYVDRSGSSTVLGCRLFEARRQCGDRRQVWSRRDRDRHQLVLDSVLITQQRVDDSRPSEVADGAAVLGSSPACHPLPRTPVARTPASSGNLPTGTPSSPGSCVGALHLSFRSGWGLSRGLVRSRSPPISTLARFRIRIYRTTK